MKKIPFFSFLAAASAAFWGCASLFEEKPADIVVYGGTSAGVTAAVQAAKEGKSVVLIAPEGRLGAMSSAGLGMTDSGKTATIGGLSREFYHRVWREYRKPETWKWQKRENFAGRGQGTKAIDDERKVMWIFEPSVAEKVFDDWVKEHKNIRLVRGERLDRESGVEKVGGRIVAISTLDGGIPLMVLLMCMCHAASLISPVHVCLVVASDYFKITMGQLIRKTIPASLVFALLMIGYYLLLTAIV